MPAEYISSTGSYFPRESPLNLFANSPALISPEQHAIAMHHQQQQHRLNSQTLSRSSSPLHSSRSHGLQPATPSSIEHAHQRHPSFAGPGSGSGGVYPPDQSIYLVAAPNPHRYMADDPLIAATSLYGGLPPGAVSPHSLTDKSIGGLSDGRGVGMGNGGPGSGSYASSGGRVMHTGANTVGYHASPRMITSFYTPQRQDMSPGASNTLGSHMQTSKWVFLSALNTHNNAIRSSQINIMIHYNVVYRFKWVDRRGYIVRWNVISRLKLVIVDYFDQ